MLDPMQAIVYAALVIFLGASPAHAFTQEVKVVGVSDGDTITVLTSDFKRVKVRLSEIDAPESKQDFGSRSQQALSALCFGKQARITKGKMDQYNRVISRVTCDGVDAQSHMVGNGMAWVYTQFSKDKSLLAMQTDARGKKLGLWAQPNPIPPWEFRRSKVTK